jgi:hypothetical protein
MHLVPSTRRPLVVALLLVAACGSGTVGNEGNGAGGGAGQVPPVDPGNGTGSGGSSTTAGSGAGGSANGSGGRSTGSGGGSSSAGSGGGSSAAPTGDAAQQCVDIINNYRATLSLPPYARWTDQEACASTEAASDSQSGTAHGAFPRCGESAQNECPGYSGSYATMLPKCLDLMWKEGPGTDFASHGHYINMTSTKYTKVACGFATTGAGKIWAVQDFK